MNRLTMICGRRKKKNAVIVFITLILITITCLGYDTYNRFKSVTAERNKFFLKFDEGNDKEDADAEQYLYSKVQENVAIKRKIQRLKTTIKHLNENQRVTNDHLFGELKFEHFVLVVQVHGNIKYLAILLDSLRRVVGVTRCLLVFSHDNYNDDINNVLRNITFAKVMQIFYPYSAQLHPKIYPGDDPDFCIKLNKCVRQEKRQYSLSQRKLFWWWTLNEVFEQLEILKRYKGYMYFIETEQYVTRDFLYMCKMMENLQPVYCPECVIIGAASSRPRPNMYRLQDARLEIDTWGWSKLSNSGIGFNRTVWNTIKTLKEHFCYFNDYHWDHSLRYLASKTDKRQFFMLYTEGPRVLPITGCGLYDNSTVCTLKTTYIAVQKFVWKIRKGLFPHNFALQRDYMVGSNSRRNASRQDGWWDDARDQEFCMFLASKGRREYY